MFSWKKIAAALGLSLTLLTASTVQAAPTHSTKATTTHHIAKHRKAATRHRKAGAKHRKAGAKHHKATAKRHAATTHRRSTTVAHRTHTASPALHARTAARPTVASHTHS